MVHDLLHVAVAIIALQLQQRSAGPTEPATAGLPQRGRMCPLMWQATRCWRATGERIVARPVCDLVFGPSLLRQSGLSLGRRDGRVELAAGHNGSPSM